MNKNQHGTWLGIVSACQEHSNQKLKLPIPSQAVQEDNSLEDAENLVCRDIRRMLVQGVNYQVRKNDLMTQSVVFRFRVHPG